MRTGATDTHELDRRVRELALEALPEAIALLREMVRVPADVVDRPSADGGDPSCGLSNHEGPRLEILRERIVELGAVASADDVGFDAFGNLVWSVEDPDDGIAAADKAVIVFDGHTDTVQALRSRWLEAIGGGIDAYDGLVDPDRVDRDFLRRELGWLPADEDWGHLLWGRGSADQLGGVVSQVFATRILLRLRDLGALRGVIVRSIASVAEEDNDGGGPRMWLRDELASGRPERVPDVFVLTEGTGCSKNGAVGIYRGQRGRMQIEVDVLGKSCHGSMPHEGRNPLEAGAAIVTEATAQAASGDAFGDDPFLGAGTRTASWARLDTPSDCAVPERFVFRFDRRLTAGEDPEEARAAIEALPAVARARDAGFRVDVRIPHYDAPSWRGVPADNPQIYPGWVTPEDHAAIRAAVDAYARVASPLVDDDAPEVGGGLRRQCRLSRWVFSTDGVGVPIRRDAEVDVPAAKAWVGAGPFHHPAMFGIGPGIEHNTHKIGECLDTREIPLVVAVLARFPSLYRETRGG